MGRNRGLPVPVLKAGLKDKASPPLWLSPLDSSPRDAGVSAPGVQSRPCACCLQRAMLLVLDLPFLEGCKCMALIFLMHGIYEFFPLGAAPCSEM